MSKKRKCDMTLKELYGGLPQDLQTHLVLGYLGYFMPRESMDLYIYFSHKEKLNLCLAEMKSLIWAVVVSDPQETLVERDPWSVR